MTAYENRIGAQSPVIWLKLDGSGAPTSSGSSTPTFTLSGTAPTTGVASTVSNTAYTFNGNGQYSIGALPSTTTTDKNFTIEAWVKMNPSTSIDYPTIYRADNGANGALIMRVRGTNIASPGLAEIYVKGSSAQISLYSTSRVDDNNWHHISLRYDGVGTLTLYIDGKPENSAATNIGTVTDIDTAGTRYFGGGLGASEYFVGTIDEFTIYGTNISAPVINGNFLVGKDSASIQSYIVQRTPEYYWLGDPVDGTTVNWYTSGTATDSTTWTRTTVSGSNISRVASTLPKSYSGAYMLNVPYASRYRTAATVYSSTEATDGDFTVGVWFKQYNSSANASALTKILGTTGSVFDMTMYSSTHSTSPGRVLWSTAGIASAGTVRVDDGNWHFLAIRKVSGNNNYLCYVDGVLDATNTTASTPVAGNWQVGDSTQGSGSASLYVDNFFLSNSSNINATDILNIYQYVFPANVDKTINETPATASAQFPDAVAIGTSTVSWSTIPATVNAEFVTPALSFSQDVDRLVSVMTADGLLADPTISAIQNVDFASGALTANADFSPTTGISIDDAYTAAPSTAHIRGQKFICQATQDIYRDVSGNYINNNLMQIGEVGNVTTWTWIQYQLPTELTSGNVNKILKASIAFNVEYSNSSAQSLNLSRNAVLWSETSNPLPNQSVSIDQLTGTFNFAAGTRYELDDSSFSYINQYGITDIVKRWITGVYDNHGFVIQSVDSQSNDYFTIYSSESSIPAERPTLIIYADLGAPNADIVAGPANSSAQMQDPNLSLGTGNIIAETPATASALAVNPTYSAGASGGFTADHLEAFGILVDPTISAIKNNNFTQSNGLTANGVFVQPQITAEGATLTISTTPATASATMPGGSVSINESTPATPITASATMVDPSVVSDFNRIIYVGAFSVAATLLDPTEAILETDDPYYQEVRFTGSQYITVPHSYGASGSSGNFDWLGAAATSVSEMTIRTSANSGTLLDGEDANTLAGAGNPLGWTLDIYGGKLRFRSWVVATNVPGTNRLVTHSIVGNKIITDNQWHHIVIQIGNAYNGKELEIFIDGELDIARYDANQTPIMAHPDRLFGNSVTTMNYAYTGPNPSNQVGSPEAMPNFTGDAMEYVFRPNITLTEYQIEQLYYAALDIATERQTSWTASAVMPEPYISGNKPKALMLNFGFDNDGLNSNSYLNGGFNPEVHDVWEYWVTRQTSNPQLTYVNDRSEPGQFVRDAVTDEPVLLDPRTIPNISRFDVIQVIGYPETSDQILTLIPQSIAGTGYDYQENLGRLEQFVSRLREIVDTYGTSLLVTSPRLAVDLGIVDDIEITPQAYETRFASSQSSQNAGLYDYRSALIDPTVHANGPVGSTTNDPYVYFDTHRNNKIRLVATQTGLTDIQDGWTLEDAVTSIPRDPLSPSRYSYKFKDTRNGMAIGDETFIAGLQLNRNELGTASGDAYGIYNAREAFLAIPSSAVKSGTVLAQLTTTYWDGTQERVNPYALAQQLHLGQIMKDHGNTQLLDYL